jgi:hypothetical protein
MGSEDQWENQDWPKSMKIWYSSYQIATWTRWDVIDSQRWRQRWSWTLHVRTGWCDLQDKE